MKTYKSLHPQVYPFSNLYAAFLAARKRKRHRWRSKEMNPEQPFYLLVDGTQPIPPLFYPMLNKCLALPLLPEWAGYLWENGRERNLITLLDEGEGQGYAAWRVLPAAEAWQGILETGLKNRRIQF